jgi:hypothetical protein
MQNGEITVHDGTGMPATKQIQFVDLVGEPSWISTYTISVKVVMRGDLRVSDKITLPPTPVITTFAAQQGIPGKLTFDGTFTIQSLRHIGSSRNPDGNAWVTVFEALQDQ